MTRSQAIEQATRMAAHSEAERIEPMAEMAARCAPFYGATLMGGPRKPIDARSVLMMASMFPRGSIMGDLASAIRAEFNRMTQ